VLANHNQGEQVSHYRGSKNWSRHIENSRQLVWHSVRQFRKTVWPKKNL